MDHSMTAGADVRQISEIMTLTVFSKNDVVDVKVSASLVVNTAVTIPS